MVGERRLMRKKKSPSLRQGKGPVANEPMFTSVYSKILYFILFYTTRVCPNKTITFPYYVCTNTFIKQKTLSTELCA